MPTSTNFRIEGVSNVISMLKTVEKNIKKEVYAGITESCLLVTKEVKTSIAGRGDEQRSVDTGRFLNSVSYEVKGIDSGIVFSPMEYSKYLEYGTSKGIRPRRHFRNSLARKKFEVINIMQKRTNTACKVGFMTVAGENITPP